MSDQTLTQAADLSFCAREPIHIPGSVQPHGILVVLEGSPATIVHASCNLNDYCAVGAQEAINRKFADVFGPAAEELEAQMQRLGVPRTPVYLSTIDLGGQRFRVVAHELAGSTIVEFERTASPEDISFRDLDPVLRTFLGGLAEVSTVQEMCAVTSREVRRMTGFDRVLVYRFDKDWNGEVIAEDRNDQLPSYLDLRFPASDIPAQARELYRLNRLRLIANADYTPVPVTPAVHPQTGAPLDMSFCVLRSVSPVHLEYMRNMGTAASMSVSILCNGQLWGLISCHHATPRYVPFEVRTGCDMVGQMLSLQIAARERHGVYEHRIRLKSVEAKLLSYMAEEDDFTVGLVEHPKELLALCDAAGAAVLTSGECHLLGETPDEGFVRRLGSWIVDQGGNEVYHTERLSEIWDEARPYATVASGVLAISVSKLHASFVMWFRPEQVQTVSWGGDPRKPVEETGDGERISPRKSFALWKEIVRGKSRPWVDNEVEAVSDLRNAIVGIVLRQAEELAEISGELERSNKELEAFSYSVSHDLRAPFRHIVGYAELLRETLDTSLEGPPRRYVDTIIESAQYAGQLVDNLLNFSQIGRATLQCSSVDMNALVIAVRQDLRRETNNRRIEWTVDRLPQVVGDPVLLRVAWQNLIANALKYSRQRDPARIEIGCAETPREYIFRIRDNGVGFEMQYVDKLFGVFQRLHRMEDFEGTGIGLANVRRIVGRHGGRTWAEGVINEGAVFYFSLPREAQKAN